MIMPEHPPRYHAYLLRCWEERGQDPPRPATWRFSLEDPGTGERRGFADLAQLVAFLEGLVEGGEGDTTTAAT